MAKIQQLAQEGFLGIHLSSIGKCDIPLCRACIHGKQHRRAIPSTSTTPLDVSHLAPGDCGSGNQVESSTPGLIPTYRGPPSKDRYHAGTLLVNHASHFLHFTPHLLTGCKEALTAKHSFELQASH
jgi:hypothetical protein